MADLYKNVNGERVKLTNAEVVEYEKLQQEFLDTADERKKGKIRSKRKSLLEEADWQIHKAEDSGGNVEAWRSYRQALRDITNGDLDNPSWPTKPS